MTDPLTIAVARPGLDIAAAFVGQLLGFLRNLLANLKASSQFPRIASTVAHDRATVLLTYW
jgi:hypothetical protein